MLPRSRLQHREVARPVWRSRLELLAYRAWPYASWPSPDAAKPAPTATAVLSSPILTSPAKTTGTAPANGTDISPNSSSWPAKQCKTYIAGIPQPARRAGEIVCPPYPTHPDLVVWPESPAPFY